MLNYLIVIFILAAVGGAYLLTFVLAEKNTPKGIAIIHGSVAALGLIGLIVYASVNGVGWISVTIFVLAAAGGFFMFGRDIVGKSIPKSLAIGHGLLALLGILLLIILYY